MSVFLFDSRLNYQKIFEQGTFSEDYNGGLITKTVAHDLGYKPNVKAWFQDNNGGYYQCFGEGGVTRFRDGTTVDCFVTVRSSASEITFEVDPNPLASGTVDVIYRIYVDDVS